MTRINLILLFFFTIENAAIFHCSDSYSNSFSKNPLPAKRDIDENKTLRNKAAIVRNLTLNKKYSDRYCFLLDMNIHSGKKRFFVYDMKYDSIVSSGLVAHGNCNNYFLQNVFFSNKPGCGCSSMGIYKVGTKYMGKFGISYKLTGLDSSNSNAYKRAIVLHSYLYVPEHEVYPDHIGNSLGCPMTSPGFFNKVSDIIDGSSKPILLYIW